MKMKMKKEAFTRVRKKLNKTQKEMAGLLGVSKKTVESYEQGLRNIPDNVRRLLYFLLFKLNLKKNDYTSLCWDEKKCSPQVRENCVAWLAKEGFFCWFITGKACEAQRLLGDKAVAGCFLCDFFKDNLHKILT